MVISILGYDIAASIRINIYSNDIIIKYMIHNVNSDQWHYVKFNSKMEIFSYRKLVNVIINNIPVTYK